MITGGLESVPVSNIVHLVGLAVSADVAVVSLNREHGQLVVDFVHGSSLLTSLTIAGLVATIEITMLVNEFQLQ